MEHILKRIQHGTDHNKYGPVAPKAAVREVVNPSLHRRRDSNQNSTRDSSNESNLDTIRERLTFSVNRAAKYRSQTDRYCTESSPLQDSLSMRGCCKSMFAGGPTIR